MRILDLFCGAGGASVGYHRVWPDAEIVGIDIEPQPDYPFGFIQADALSTPVDFDSFDFIHASPPCQAHSVNTPVWAKSNHGDFIPAVRSMLQRSSTPFVIENVPGAPVRKDLMLCGSMFNMQVQRHRWFEFSSDITVPRQPTCDHGNWLLGAPHTVTGHADGKNFRRPRYLGFRDTEHAKDLMDMPWATTTRGVTEAIPPAYTTYVGACLSTLPGPLEDCVWSLSEGGYYDGMSDDELDAAEVCKVHGGTRRFDGDDSVCTDAKP